MSSLALPLAAERTSVAAIDVGSVFTKAFWLEDVEGERRLIAVGRSPTAGDDGQLAVPDAIDRALAQAQVAAGRAHAPAQRLLLTSLGAMPRLALVVPRGEDARTVAAALEALPLRVLEPLTLDGPAADPEQLLGQVEAQHPDVVLLHGGQGDQPAAPAAAEALGHGLRLGLPVILAGDPAFVTAVQPLLEAAPLVVAGRAAGPQAVDDAEEVRQAVQRHIAGRLRNALGAVRWNGAGGDAHSSLDGVCAATELIADRYDVDVLTLDLGAGHAQAVAATGVGGQRRVVTVVRDDLGVRLGRRAIPREAGPAAVNRWLPADLDEETLLADVRTALAAPAALPETVEELLREHAFGREALRLLLAELAGAIGARSANGGGLPPIDLLVGSGGLLAGAPRLMQAALLMLDAVQPEALTQLALDRTTALPLIGQLSRREGPGSLGAALERDGLLNLGLCIAPIGTAREGDPALRVEVVYASRSPVTIEVPYGSIEVVPLPPGERASLKLWPSREFDVGLGKGSAATPRAEVEGGAVGILVDARGRPMAGFDSAEKRQAKLMQWLQTLRAYPPLSFVQAAPGAPAAGRGGAG